MAHLVTTCPHCGARRITFNFYGRFIRQSDQAWIMFGICGNCAGALIVDVQNLHGQDLLMTPGDVTSREDWKILRTYPAPPSVDAPDHVPVNVAHFYKQAATNGRSDDMLDAAGGMYRKTLDTGLKAIAPDLSNLSLMKRIERLVIDGRLTTEIGEWSHTVRLDGNDVHEEVPMTREAIEQMHALTYFILMYLFTLPAQVKAARERRQGE